MFEQISDTPVIEFPFDWDGRIIAADSAAVETEIVERLQARGIDRPVTRGNSSRTGRYVTFNVCITFTSRESMDEVTRSLAAIAGVKMIL